MTLTRSGSGPGVGDGGDPCRRGGDADAARPGDGRLDGLLRLHVEHVDQVAHGAGLERLAADAYHDAGHRIADGDGLVAGNDLGLGEVALAHDLAWTQRALRRQADSLVGADDDVRAEL